MKGRDSVLLEKKKKITTFYKKREKKTGKQVFLVFVLCISLLLSSCNGISNFTDRFSNHATYKSYSSSQTLEKENLVLLLISCITNLSEIRNVYSKIPQSQLDGISFATFDEYIRTLNDMIKGPVEYYRFLFGEERDKILQPIKNGAQDQEDLIERTIPIEIHMRNSEDIRYLYIQEQENGFVYLSKDWINTCTFIYQYAVLYFRALDTQTPNQAAVESLLKHAIVPETDGKISSLVIDYKAKELIEYYQRQVRDRFDLYQIESFDFSQLTYVQPRFLNEATGEYIPRSVRFIRRTPNLISVKDTVTSPLDSRDFELYKNGKGLHVTIGGWIDLSSLDQLIGEERLITSTEMNTTESDEMKTIVVSYKSLTITLRVQSDDEGELPLMRMRITRIRLRGEDSEFSFGSGIKNGMAVDSLLRLYPFADLENYMVYTSRDNTDYQMFFSIDPTNGGRVTEVNLETLLNTIG